MSKEEILKEDIMHQFERLNNLVKEHYVSYKEKPSIIIMSKGFQYGLGYIMHERFFQSDIYGNKIEFLFGIQCISSPRLKELEFEVY